MALQDNRPTTTMVRQMLTGLSAKNLAKVDDGTLALLLGASIQWVQGNARTRFNARLRTEVRDGNGTSFMNLMRWPSLRVRDVTVQTPIIGYRRTYTQEEIQSYPWNGQIKIYTYKMLAETVTGLAMGGPMTNWGTIFPPIPNAVKIVYSYGFGQYDPELDRTTYDGGVTFEAGDTRDDDEQGTLVKLQQAALLDAASSYLAQVAGQSVGLIQSVSFDGFSKGMNPQAYGPQVQAMIESRDAMLERKARPFMVTVGTHD